MDLKKLTDLAKNNPSAAKAFLSKKKLEKPQPEKVSKQSSFLNKKEPDRTLKLNDKVFTEKQLDTIVRSLVAAEVNKIPKAKDGKTPSKQELKELIAPMIPVFRQPRDGKDGEVSEKHIDEITNRILKQVGKTPDLTDAIINVFKDEKIKAEDLPGFEELKKRVERLAQNQKYQGGRGIASGYTDSDVIRVANANGGFGGSSPLTTKGDLYTYDTDDARLPVGSNGQVLQADSNEATGLKWATIAGTGDVTAASAFGTDNVLIRSDGTGKGVQATGISVADTTNNVSGLGTLASASGTLTIDETAALSDKQNVLAEGAFVDGDKTKLDGIEANADVTDTANVTAAGALMDSEVDVNIKTLSLPGSTTISAFGKSLVDDADAATARATLGVVPGTDVQAFDAGLNSIAGLTTAADRMIYTTASDTYAVTALTSAARSILDDTSTSAIRTTLGVGTAQSPQFTAVNIGNATDTTVARASAGDISVEGNIVYRAGGTDVPVADGGTGASTAAGARTNLGVDVTKATNFKVKAITVEDPTSSEDLTMFFTDDAITVTQLNAVLLGSSTPSVTWTVRHSSDRSAAGNEVVTSGTTTTSTTTGSEVTSFNDATIPAGSWVWLETSAQSGTVDELNVTIEYTVD